MNRRVQNLSERDKEGVRKTFSGIMKVMYPSGVATKEEMRELLTFVMEGRKRVKDNLMRIDSTYDPVDFWFEDLESGEKTYVQTLEEKEFPEIYKSVRSAECRVRSEETNSDSSEATLTLRPNQETRNVSGASDKS